MFNDITALVRDEKGATLVEYSLIIALVAVAAMAALTTLSGGIQGLLNAIGGQLSGAATTAGS